MEPEESKEDGARSRARFDEEEDLELLRQIVRIEPYRAEYGKVMTAWDTVAVGVSDATALEVTGRACRDRFNILMKWYKSFSAASKAATGVSEAHTEKMDLLEDFVRVRLRALVRSYHIWQT